MLQNRLLECRKKKNFTQQALADLYNERYPGQGLSKGTLSKYEKGKQIPSATRLRELADLLGVSADYLLGAGTAAAPLSPDAEDIVFLPILGTIAAGLPIYAVEDIEGYLPIAAHKVTGATDYFYLRVQGESMVGVGILPGSLVLIRRQEDVDSGEIAAVMVGGDEATLKRVIKKDGVLVLQAENPDYPPRIFTGRELENIRILGKALEVTITKKL